MHSCLTDEDFVGKKGKGTKKCVIKQEIKLQDQKGYLRIIIPFWNSNKGSWVRHTMYPLKRPSRSPLVQMMIREYKSRCKSWNSVQIRIDQIPENQKLNIRINFNEVLGENTQQHNTRWLHIPDHSHRKLVVGGSRLGKMSVLLNLINHQSHIHKTHLYAKDLYESRYQFLIQKWQDVGMKHFKDSNTFI